MTTTVLAYFPSPGQGVWYLGPFPIRAYALCIIAGIIAALLIGDRRWAARGGERGVIYDIALWAVPFGLIGGRLYHVMTDWKTYFGPGGAGLQAALKIWEGGLGIWGAVALGAVGAWIGCRRKGIPLPAFGDAVAPGVVLAQAIGRLGNYFNQELYGRETTVPWGMEIFYRSDSSGVVDVHSLDGVSTGQVAAVVHPTFLYELLWNLLVFVFLIWADRRFRLGHGRLFALYVAAYSLGRFGVELLRDDAATHIAGIRINVFTATFVFIAAVVYFLLAPKGRENPDTLRGKQPLYEDDEAVADEWADDLLSAAGGTGVLAAATVAGEHESEDSEAVGDVDDGDALERTDLIEPVVDESEADAEDEADAEAEGVEPAAEESESDGEADVAADVDEAVADEPADEATDEVADADDEVSDAAADPVADGDETVIVYQSVESSTMVVYESGTEGEATDDTTEEPADEAVEEPTYEDEAVDEVVEEADGDDVAAVTDESADDSADVEAEEPELESEPVAEVEAVAEDTEIDAATIDGATIDAPTSDAATIDGATAEAIDEATDGAAQPKLGATLKRLLWGAGSRRGQ